MLKSAVDKDLSIIDMRHVFYAIRKYGNDIDVSLLKEFLKNEHIQYKSFVWSFIQRHEKFNSESDIETFIEVTCDFMEVIKDSLLENKENVYLRGFGSFIVKHRAEKTARNISKNTTIMIAAHDFPSFKPAKSFVSKMKGE